MDEFQKHRWWSLLDRVGSRLTGATFDNYQCITPQQKQLVALLRKYSDNITQNRENGGGVVLIGTRGAGKDHLCFCVASAANKAGLTVGWASGEELFGDARDAMDSTSSEYELSRTYTDPDFLWLSDPIPPCGRKEDSGYLTDWQMRFLYRIVDARYRQKKPLLVTANATDLKDFEGRIGLQVADRLYHGSLRFMCKWTSGREPHKED